MISGLRKRLNLSQTTFGHELHSSAMGVSRWERGAQEPPSHSYIELGNLAGDPDCWFFWGRAGLRSEDLMRVLPKLRSRLRNPKWHQFQIVQAGGAGKKAPRSQLVAIPLLKVVAGTPGERGDNVPDLHEALVESMIAAPKEWCPNPATTNCVRVRGNSMNPLVYDGYILAVDSSQNDRAKLDGNIVIAWHRDVGLTVSRFQRYDHTEVLHPENRLYKSIVLDRKNKWKILAKVLWWIGRAP
jgi:SOS-response transcriptional repressor LexA